MRYDLDGILCEIFDAVSSCVAITGGVMPLQVISLLRPSVCAVSGMTQSSK
jgi:hypothetical protein